MVHTMYTIRKYTISNSSELSIVGILLKFTRQGHRDVVLGAVYLWTKAKYTSTSNTCKRLLVYNIQISFSNISARL